MPGSFMSFCYRFFPSCISLPSIGVCVGTSDLRLPPKAVPVLNFAILFWNSTKRYFGVGSSPYAFVTFCITSYTTPYF